MIIALLALALADDTSSAAPVATDRLAELSLSRVDAPGSWTVQDGRSHPIDARTWAILTGEVDVLSKIEASRKKGQTLGWGLVIGGGTVALSSMIPLFTIEEALGTNEGSDDFNKIGTRNDVRVATAFSMIGAGALLAGTGFAARALADHRALDLSRHVDAAAADASIALYNRRLQDTLTVVPLTAPEEILDVEDPAAATGAGTPGAAGGATGAPDAAPASGATPEAAPKATPDATPKAPAEATPKAAPAAPPAPEAAPASTTPPAPAPSPAPTGEAAPAPTGEAAPAPK